MLARLKIPLSWREITKRTVREFFADNAFDLGAQQAYYFFFALFPALLTLLSIASFFTIANLIDEVVRMIGEFVPPDVLTIVSDQIKKISDSNHGGLLTVGFVLTVWSSSGAMSSIITTLNVAYDITESRPWWKVRLIAIGLTLGMAVFILLSLVFVLIGPDHRRPSRGAATSRFCVQWAWLILQWPVVFFLVTTGNWSRLPLCARRRAGLGLDHARLARRHGPVAPRLARFQGLPRLFRQLQRDIRCDRRRDRSSHLVVPIEPRHPFRRGIEFRDRARLPLRKSGSREGSWRQTPARSSCGALHRRKAA